MEFVIIPAVMTAVRIKSLEIRAMSARLIKQFGVSYGLKNIEKRTGYL
jgi:hypothetical protein